MNSSFIEKTRYERAAERDISCVLYDAKILETEFKVMSNKQAVSFVRCCHTLKNGWDELYYMPGKMISLEEFIINAKEGRILTAVKRTMEAFNMVKDLGFLKMTKVDASPKRIFIDNESGEVSIVYYPIDVNLYDSEAEMIAELKKNIASSISRSKVARETGIVTVIKYLSDGMLGLSDIAHLIGKNVVGSEGADSDKSGDSAGSGKKNLVLRPVSTTENLPTFEITKTPFIIGKSNTMADGVISGNDMISRRHCRIEYEEGQYYAVDMKSLNHTWVNGKRLMPENTEGTIIADVREPIHDGDVIRLAKTEFYVIIE